MMSDVVEIPSNELTFPTKRTLHAEKKILGAKWEVSRWQDSSGDQVLVTIDCNKGMVMNGVEAEATVRVEIGHEEDAFYSKHEFPLHFHVRHQSEQIQLDESGEIYINNDFGNSQEFDVGALGTYRNVRVTLTVHSVTGPKIISVPPFKFRDPNCRHDKVLVMDDGTKFYVSSEILSVSSAYFDALFHSDFAESKQDEVSIGGVSAKDFEEVLKQLYPGYDGIQSVVSALAMLEMADRFDIPALTKRSVDYLCAMDELRSQRFALEMMMCADTYQLLELQDKSFKALVNDPKLANHIRRREQSADYRNLPGNTRENIQYALLLQNEKKQFRSVICR